MHKQEGALEFLSLAEVLWGLLVVNVERERNGMSGNKKQNGWK